jgi:hypothetical protein
MTARAPSGARTAGDHGRCARRDALAVRARKTTEWPIGPDSGRRATHRVVVDVGLVPILSLTDRQLPSTANGCHVVYCRLAASVRLELRFESGVVAHPIGKAAAASNRQRPISSPFHFWSAGWQTLFTRPQIARHP